MGARVSSSLASLSKDKYGYLSDCLFKDKYGYLSFILSFFVFGILSVIFLSVIFCLSYFVFFFVFFFCLLDLSRSRFVKRNVVCWGA